MGIIASLLSRSDNKELHQTFSKFQDNSTNSCYVMEAIRNENYLIDDEERKLIDLQECNIYEFESFPQTYLRLVRNKHLKLW